MSITKKELALICPAALATKPAAHCSPRYSLLPTIDAIAALEGQGFELVSAKQDKVRPDKWGREKHCRHKVTMRHKSTAGMTRELKMLNVVPEILIVNSSDASCQFEMDLGVFRLVCSNGLIVMDKIDSFSQIHKAATVEAVIARAKQLSANSKPLFDKIAKWSKVKLNPLAVQRYAEQAIVLRMGEERAKGYDPMTIVQSHRPEDEEPTLWNVMNRAQENGMLGRVQGISSAGRMLHGRALLGIAAESDFNKGLWAMTEAFAKKAGV